MSILYVILIGLFVWWLLNYTTLGRGVFAIGGNKEVAIRSGFNVKGILLTVFGLMGMTSAL
jgi:ribose/xylose/arabinose/galactoside ABC-type transport system permease subunit